MVTGEPLKCEAPFAWNKTLKQNAKIILASHLGRPNGKRDPKLSLAPVCQRLSQLIKKEVLLVSLILILVFANSKSRYCSNNPFVRQ